SGFEEEVMSAARSAGARGGTIFNARGTAESQDLVKFMGITLHPNKEIVFILSSPETRDEIMNAVKKNTGLATEGAGIIFSLPVDSVLGVNL
ncbi:MAG: P-II family nitrogen regulator, partial [Clostridia bacterium]|nr:P-II family nitrogen regulator [Clostridia bacterium]